MFDACRHLINWDFDRVWRNTRPYANQYTCKLTAQSDGWYQVAAENCPENYGFNAIPLRVPEPGTKVELQFEGVNGKQGGYVSVHPEKAGWRYGFVAVKDDGKSIYGEMSADKKGKLTFKVPENEKLVYLWLVVMGAPEEHWMNPSPESGEKDAQWPYRIRLKGTDLKN